MKEKTEVVTRNGAVHGHDTCGRRGIEKITEMVYKSVNGAWTRCQWMRKREVKEKKRGRTIVQQRRRAIRKVCC